MTVSPNVNLTPAPAGPRDPVPVEAELDALRRIAEIFNRLDKASRLRTAAWVADKWGAS